MNFTTESSSHDIRTYLSGACVSEIVQTKEYTNVRKVATTCSFINLFKSAQHVSGDKFAHPQEHFLTVYTAFGTMYCNDKL